MYYFFKLLIPLFILITIILLYGKNQNSNIKKSNKPFQQKSITNKNSNIKSIRDSLNKCLELILNEKDSRTLKSYVNSNTVNSDVLDFLFSQNFIDFQFKNDLWFYKQLDHKSKNSEFDYTIRNMLLKNYSFVFDSKDLLESNKDLFIHQSFNQYQSVLNELGFSLRDIDINNDSYQIIVVKNDKLEILERELKKLGLKSRVIKN